MLRVTEYFAKQQGHLRSFKMTFLRKALIPYQYFVVKHVRILYHFKDIRC